MDEQEIFNMMVLARIGSFHLATMRQLINIMGSATAVMEHRDNIRGLVPECPPRIAESLRASEEAMKRAETEMEYNRANGIKELCLHGKDYPRRLRECDDAPLILFYKGTADLNQRHIICMIGTRHCTIYGQDLIRRFMADLKVMCPDVLVISGLAYGIDINAHRRALENGLDTVAVLAHGMDYLYPPRHKDTALKMIEHGGLVTEYFTMTNADKVNFVRRNRLVAGMADACILVESASKGGGLITARLARDYNRDVFAFPGRADDRFSQGCNNLIRDNVAGLISNAEDFVKAMSWNGDAELAALRNEGIQRQIFPQLSDEEKMIVDCLKKDNDLNINTLLVRTNMPINALTATLFGLEMKGVVKALAGGAYHLLD